MPFLIKRRSIKRITVNTLRILLILCVVVFIVGPLIYKYCYKLQEIVVFSSYVNLPRNLNPSKYNLKGIRNFYIESDENIKLGVWQILPEVLSENTTIDDTDFENVLKNGQHVLIYYHGNAGNRATSHRIQLYQILRKHFHVITFDYRSYGDSSNIAPTEEGAVKDCIAVYKWISRRTSSEIFIWGHSLGCALSLHMLSILSHDNISPTGLILESPFNNMREEITEHPLTWLFRHLPWFRYTIVDSMEENNFIFANDEHILNVNCSIVILHSEDDLVVPYKLGRKLYETKLKSRQYHQGSIEFIGFPKTFGYGHKGIYQASNLSTILENFVEKAMKEKKQYM